MFRFYTTKPVGLPGLRQNRLAVFCIVNSEQFFQIQHPLFLPPGYCEYHSAGRHLLSDNHARGFDNLDSVPGFQRTLSLTIQHGSVLLHGRGRFPENGKCRDGLGKAEKKGKKDRNRHARCHHSPAAR